MKAKPRQRFKDGSSLQELERGTVVLRESKLANPHLLTELPEPSKARKRDKAREQDRNLAGETRPEAATRRRRESAVLHWLQNRKDGRAYLGRLLVRLHGLL